MSSRPDLRIAPCDYEAAKFACLRWHYSQTIPANKSNYIGVWENKIFVGAIIFGLGAAPSLGKPYGLGIFEICELTRVALGKHHHAVTRMIAIALKMLKRHNPGLRMVVSFADKLHGHHGGIYQGGGWIYAGTTQPSQMWKLLDGSLVDPRRFNGHGHNKSMQVPRGSVLIRTPPKHRYLMPLDDEMRAKIAPLAKPYPKRAGSAASGTIDFQSVGGGATPTPALPNNERRSDGPA